MRNLLHLGGKRVARIRRVYYVHHDTVVTQGRAIELHFHDDSFLLIDTYSDWTLRVAQEEWSDPFAHPLTKEDSEYVRDYGKWSAFDISHNVPARYLLGQTVSGFQEIRDEIGQIMEAVLEFGEYVIKAYSYGGEIRVEWVTPDVTLCDIPHLLPPE